MMKDPDFVYVARPIDTSDHEELPEWVDDLVEVMSRNSSSVFYLPAKAFQINPRADVNPKLRMANNAVLNEADALVVFYTPGVKSWGVPAEIERALMLGLPIAYVIIGEGDLSWSQVYAEGNVSTFRFSDIDKALDGVPSILSSIQTVGEQDPEPTTNLLGYGFPA